MTENLGTKQRYIFRANDRPSGVIVAKSGTNADQNLDRPLYYIIQYQY